MSILRVLGNNRKLCDGVARRDLIQAGALSLYGLTLADLLRLQAAQAAASSAAGADSGSRGHRTFGKAKSVLILFLYGSPGQLDMWDMKPDAPEDIRGPFRPIRTSNPGIDITENLPKMAKWMHRLSTVRTVTHSYPIHGVSFALTGMANTDLAREVNVRDPRHWPYFGSVVDYVDTQERTRSGKPDHPLPQNLVLPHRFGRPGPQPHWLGSRWAPTVSSWEGKSTGADPYGQGRENPYGGITSDTRFHFMPGQQARDITVDRLSRRNSLLEQFDQGRQALEQHEDAQAWDRSRQLAMNLLTSEKLRNAMNIQAEPMKVREQYGMTLFGQATLCARRLVEAGARVTTVFWDEYNLGNSAWDTHVFLVNRMKNELCPGFDMAFNALMHDLQDRGLLDETLVCVMSEHGRTPKFTRGYDGFGPQGGGGRDHWSHAYCNLFAGAGIKEGAVIGTTDKTGGFPDERPVSPKDVLCTIYHLLGIDPH
ncbi:MAG: DUF1501 domain-containing protein, partial [Armatimonadetes bacterium]|nr:DUF1501 domain-containing protein [Armatimonadota bacterium]